MRASYVTLTLSAFTAMVLAAGCSGSSSPEGKLFEATARARCTGCHGPSQWEGKKFTAAEWKTILDRMVKNGAKLSEEEYKHLLVGPGK